MTRQGRKHIEEILMKSRRFRRGEVNHVYQRTIDRFNIFYSIADYLVYFTIFCTSARRYDVTIWGLCLMIDHIHSLIQTQDREILSNLMSHITSVFVREYNRRLSRRGPLFEERFGSAPKQDKKRLISSIIYVGNNPVEKTICRYAEQYRWNFIAYMDSEHPFSEKIIVRQSSCRMKKALKQVSIFHSQGKYLNYAVIGRIFNGLSNIEQNQLIDYIISRYNVIDKDSVIRYFGSYSHLRLSMHSTTGSEYDITEERGKWSDSAYNKLALTAQDLGYNDVSKVIMLNNEAKLGLAYRLAHITRVPMVQINKFLHLKRDL